MRTAAMTPEAQKVYDRVLAVAREFPGLVTSTVHSGTCHHVTVVNEAVAPGPDGAVCAPRFGMEFFDSGVFDSERANHPFAWELDHDGLRDAVSSGDADRAATIVRTGLEALSTIAIPDSYRRRSMTSFSDIIVEKGADGLYRERPAIDTDTDTDAA